jgi:hypothetical protein
MTMGFLVSAAGQAASARTIEVPAGDNLQHAINSAQGGDVIALENGATFTGNFVLPGGRSGSPPVIIRPTNVEGLPGPGARLRPQEGLRLPRLHSPNGMPALRTARGAAGWRIELIELTALPGSPAAIVALGDGSSEQRTPADVPRDLTLDRCYIHGDAQRGQKRCITLNSAETTVTGSHVADCKAVGQDSQAIAGWNGPGPFTISNNYLEGAGDNILFGGADPAIPDLVPSDIAITGNTLEKPPAWRAERWQVKNLLELKNARRVTIAGNIFRHNWQAAQSGYAILFTVRNQDGRCEWCQVEDVTFERNRIEHVAGGVSILGRDDQHKSRQTKNIVIRNNVVDDLNNRAWGGSGYFLLLLGEPRDILIEHNTVIQPHAFGLIQVEGPPVQGFVFRSNLTQHSAYGIIGRDHGPGRDTISFYFPGSTIEGNVIAGADARRYPGGNEFPSLEEMQAQFVAFASGDYRLAPNSRLRRANKGGADIGADLSKVPND